MVPGTPELSLGTVDTDKVSTKVPPKSPLLPVRPSGMSQNLSRPTGLMPKWEDCIAEVRCYLAAGVPACVTKVGSMCDHVCVSVCIYLCESLYVWVSMYICVPVGVGDESDQPHAEQCVCKYPACKQ